MKKEKFDVGKSPHIVVKHGSTKKKQTLNVRKRSHIATKHGSSGVDDGPILESKHKIFLSHSGAQKEFVEHLCKALEDRCHYPFFDKRPESLPKGKEFPSLIIKAVQQCQLLVVVVSNNYFMSKWPMIELNAFIQAAKVLKLNVNVAILPLFYRLSVSDLKNAKRRQKWLEKWEMFAKDDLVEGRIKVEDWCYALDELMKFNGLPYDRKLKEIVAYENEIVSHICTLVLPDIKWHDSHVQGNVHEVLCGKMKQIGLSSTYKVKVIGIYGVRGIGKTTTCKTLCNKLSNEYEGRVCHVEFDSTCSNSKKLLQNAIINLTRKSADFVRQLDEGKCKYILHNNLYKQRMFLAIDNVSNNDNSIKQAQMFLDFPFHKDSLVLVTAQSQSTLVRLEIHGDACLEIPELKKADAISLFLHYAAPWEKFTTKKDIDSIKECVKKCYFCEDGRCYKYHPKTLETVGRQLRGFKGKPIEWKQRLSKLSLQPTQPKKEEFGAHLQIDYPPLINAKPKLEEIKPQYFLNVLVLQLYGLNFVFKSLNLKDVICLQNLQNHEFQDFKRFEGLESLSGVMMERHVGGQFPTSLQYLYILGPSVLSESNVLSHCNNLIKMKLGSMEVVVLLDSSNCLSLKTTKFYDIICLQAFSVPIAIGSSAIGSSRLCTHNILCIDDIHIPKLDRLHGLAQLFGVKRCDTIWKEPSLLSPTKLQKLGISTFTKHPKLCIPHQLQELYYDIYIRHKAPCLNAFKQLQVLDLSYIHSLTQIYGMGDLPALQSLNLYHCISLERLPDLSKSKSLEELNLKGCIGLQLYKEDFETLATLPLLHCVLFSSKSKQKEIKLDINGKKVLQYLGPTFDAPNSLLASKREGELEEQELRLPPFEIGGCNHFVKPNIEELKNNETSMEELHIIDSNVDNTESDMENILKTDDMTMMTQMTQRNSNLDVLRAPFNCSILFWFVVDYIKEFWIAKIFT